MVFIRRREQLVALKKRGKKVSVAQHLGRDIIQMSEFSHRTLLVFTSYLTQKQSDCLLGRRGYLLTYVQLGIVQR